MDKGHNLGRLIEDGDRRCDAVHIAVAPVMAAERLVPGSTLASFRKGTSNWSAHATTTSESWIRS
jgi:hypothetical protein